MRFLLDENVELRLAASLQKAGHDVTAIARDYPHALTDRAVLTLAAIERRILITNDRDFGALIFQQQLPHAGVIYFRLPLASTVEDKIARLAEVLAQYEDALGQFLVVRERSIRVRPG